MRLKSNHLLDNISSQSRLSKRRCIWDMPKTWRNCNGHSLRNILSSHSNFRFLANYISKDRITTVMLAVASRPQFPMQTCSPLWTLVNRFNLSQSNQESKLKILTEADTAAEAVDPYSPPESTESKTDLKSLSNTQSRLTCNLTRLIQRLVKEGKHRTKVSNPSLNESKLMTRANRQWLLPSTITENPNQGLLILFKWCEIVYRFIYSTIPTIPVNDSQY